MKDESHNQLRFITTADGSHTLYSEQFGATYHSVNGAIIESQHVFIDNGLVYQFNRQPLATVNILEMGFGSGLNAYLTYLKSRELGLAINYHTIEAFPVSLTDALKLNYAEQQSRTNKQLFNKLHECLWNKEYQLTSLFSFTKYKSSPHDFTVDIKFDLIYYDAFSPKEQPELWTELLFKDLFRLLNTNGVLVTYCAQGQMKRNLKAAGFKVQTLAGPPGKREMTRGIK